MAKYRKKPVVVEAEVYKKGLEDGFGCDLSDCHNQYPCKNCEESTPYIVTLEGRNYVTEGDYIITGVKGERYPCKPDIFEMTYELAEE